MESTYPWYRQLSADERAWVSLVAHAGISAFLEWASDSNESPQLTADVFGTAPRRPGAQSMSLEQTVDHGTDDQSGSSSRRSRHLASHEDRPSAAHGTGSDPAVLARDRLLRRPRSTRERPRPAAPGTPASKRWSSTALLRDEMDASVAWPGCRPGVVIDDGAAHRGRRVPHPSADVERPHSDVLAPRIGGAPRADALLSGMHGDDLVARRRSGRQRRGSHRARHGCSTPHFGPGPVVDRSP